MAVRGSDQAFKKSSRFEKGKRKNEVFIVQREGRASNTPVECVVCAFPVLPRFLKFFLLLSYGNKDKSQAHPLDKAIHHRQLPDSGN